MKLIMSVTSNHNADIDRILKSEMLLNMKIIFELKLYTVLFDVLSVKFLVLLRLN